MGKRRNPAEGPSAADPATGEDVPRDDDNPEEEPREPAGRGSRDEAGRAADPGIEPGEADRLRSELDELNDRHLRLAAEFENFRRRSHTQLGESGARAQAALVSKLLDVLDDFERVSSLDPDSASIDSVLEGVELVERKLHRVLSDAGLESLAPEGEPFDPNCMEAIMREPAESEDEDDRVARVLQRGFRFRDHLVRPARVSVRKFDG